jgi:hypothetical protein
MKKGFIIFQIDGFSLSDLNEAIERGSAPFLRYLVKNKKFKINKAYCGLSPLKRLVCLMYGKEENFPGLTWFDKKKNRFVSMYNLDDIKEFDRKLKDGIFDGGTTVGTIFSGGSKESLGSVANINGPSLSALLSSFSKLEIFFYLISAILAIITDLIVALFTKLKKGAFFEGVFIEKILHIYTSGLAQRAIKRGTLSLYVNFTAFDRRSHRLGKNNLLAKLAIRNIDKEIKKIYDLASKANLINYDFFVITDHGQTESLPFKDYFKKSLKETLENNLKTEVIDGTDAEKGIIIHQVEDLLNEIRWLKRTSWFLRLIARRYYHKYCLSFLPGRIVLVSHGDRAHLYFNAKKSRIFGEEIEKLYPGFLKFILEHKGIELLAFLSKKGIKILGKRGQILIIGNREKLKGDDPLSGTFDRKFILESIKEIVKIKNSGDLIIFSSKIEKNLLTFAPYFSCHAGIDKDEQEIFIISPNSFRMSQKNIENPKKLYQFFRNYSK